MNRVAPLKHLALVMDGNRRWAQQRGWRSLRGHRAGAQAAQQAIEFCVQNGIEYLSLYTFSIENFRRSPVELRYLFDLIVSQANEALTDFVAKGIRVRFIGDRSLFPAHVVPTIEKLEQQTAAGTTLNLNLLFCYGARQEIMSGIKTLLKKIKIGDVPYESVSPKDFEACLWTNGMPEPDLIIRTGGVQRLSNFLLYQAAYSELAFLDCYWPDITVEKLQAVVDSYAKTKRNFGQ